jgi:hypothetical protein
MFTFLIGLAVLGGVLFWLHRMKSADVAACAAVLGLSPAGTRSTRGTTAEGFEFHETLTLAGTMHGCAAEVAERRVRYNRGRPSGARRQQGSLLTVLRLMAVTPRAVTFRLQPAGMMGAIERLQQGETPPVVATGDAAFDAAWRLYAPEPAAALLVLTPARREAIMALRAQAGVPLPANAAGAMASALLIGTLEVTAAEVSYTLLGTPSKKIALHLQAAAPLLADLAR